MQLHRFVKLKLGRRGQGAVVYFEKPGSRVFFTGYAGVFIFGKRRASVMENGDCLYGRKAMAIRNPADGRSLSVG